MGVVVEQLRDEEIGAQVLLHAGVFYVGIQAFGFGVAFGVTGAGDAKIEMFFDVGDQVGSVGEFVSVRAGGVQSDGRSPRRAMTFSMPECCNLWRTPWTSERVLGDAGEMGHHLKGSFGFEARGDFFGKGAGASAGAVGDRNEIGVERLQRLGHINHALNPLSFPRREELEGDGAPVVQNVLDFQIIFLKGWALADGDTGWRGAG